MFAELHHAVPCSLIGMQFTAAVQMYLIYLIFLTVGVVIRLVSDFWKWYPTLSFRRSKVSWEHTQNKRNRRPGGDA